MTKTQVTPLPQGINTAQAYATIAAPDQSGAVAATLGQTIPVDFAARSSTKTMSAFTVGGWFRLTETLTAASTNLFTAPGQCNINVTAAGLVTLAFGPAGSTPQVTSTSGITDTEWHYICVGVQQLTGGQSPTAQVEIAIDSLSVADEAVATTAGSATQGMCTIGGVGMGFVSWSIWDLLLGRDLFLPDFGPPKTLVDPVPAIAAFDFANGSMEDASGNNVSITANAGPSYMPRLSLTPGGGNMSSMTPAADDGVTAFGSPTTWMGWVQLPTNQDEMFLFATPQNYVRLRWTSQIDDTNSSYLIDIDNSTGTTFTNQTGFYVHITTVVAIDGGGDTLASVFVNGVFAGDTSTPGTLPAGTVTLFQATGPYSVHGVSLWNKELTEAEMTADMAGTDPTAMPGLQAYYALQHDLVNSVTGRAATVNLGALTDIVEDQTISGQITRDLTSAAKVEPAIDQRSRLDFRQDRKLAAAAAAGIDVTAPGDESAMPEQYRAFMRWYDEQITSLGDYAPAPQHQARAREELLRNLRIGEGLRQGEVAHGQFDVVVEDAKTVVYFSDQDGRHEVYRFDEVLDPQTQWLLTIITDCVGVLCSMFGFSTPVTQMNNVLRVIALTLPTMKNALLDALDDGHTSAGHTIIAVFGEIYSAGILFTVVKGLVTGSWWSFIFTALSVLGQIVAFIVGGPGYLALKLAQVGVALGKLLYDMTQYPSAVPVE